jgi:formamidopyrimidine-DNA glycosylase
MPELPEVETISSGLRSGRNGSPPLVGEKILRAGLLWDRTLAEPSPEKFLPRIVGQTILDIGRRGKFVVIQLSMDTLLIHLRMSGDLRVEPANLPPDPYDRLVIEFESGLRLAFNDTRKFGRVWLVSNPLSVLNGLGPEPLDESLTPQDFFHMLHARHRQIKPLLLDQSFLAGLGNIYTDEALFLAHLHPLTLSDSLSYSQAEQLLYSIRRVLDEGIRQQGASIDWVYRGGDFQNYFNVYGRKGEPCPECGTPIARIVIGQRGTHFCPNCQPFQR